MLVRVIAGLVLVGPLRYGESAQTTTRRGVRETRSELVCQLGCDDGGVVTVVTAAAAVALLTVAMAVTMAVALAVELLGPLPGSAESILRSISMQPSHGGRLLLLLLLLLMLLLLLLH